MANSERHSRAESTSSRSQGGGKRGDYRAAKTRAFSAGSGTQEVAAALQESHGGVYCSPESKGGEC